MDANADDLRNRSVMAEQAIANLIKEAADFRAQVVTEVEKLNFDFEAIAATALRRSGALGMRRYAAGQWLSVQCSDGSGCRFSGPSMQMKSRRKPGTEKSGEIETPRSRITRRDVPSEYRALRQAASKLKSQKGLSDLLASGSDGVPLGLEAPFLVLFRRLQRESCEGADPVLEIR